MTFCFATLIQPKDSQGHNLFQLARLKRRCKSAVRGSSGGQSAVRGSSGSQNVLSPSSSGFNISHTYHLHHEFHDSSLPRGVLRLYINRDPLLRSMRRAACLFDRASANGKCSLFSAQTNAEISGMVTALVNAQVPLFPATRHLSPSRPLTERARAGRESDRRGSQATEQK